MPDREPPAFFFSCVRGPGTSPIVWIGAHPRHPASQLHRELMLHASYWVSPEFGTTWSHPRPRHPNDGALQYADQLGVTYNASPPSWRRTPADLVCLEGRIGEARERTKIRDPTVEQMRHALRWLLTPDVSTPVQNPSHH